MKYISNSNSRDSGKILVPSEIIGSPTPKQQNFIRKVCGTAASYIPYVPPYISIPVCELAVGQLIKQGQKITAQSVFDKIKNNPTIKKWTTSAPAKPVVSPVVEKVKLVQTDTPYFGYSMPNTSTSVRNAPAAKSVRVRGNNKPRMRNGSKGVIIKHSEMIGSLKSAGSSGNYASYAYVINPGKTDMFTWLSTMAGNFDKYRIMNMNIKYVSSSPTSIAGKVGIGIDYDSTDPMPADRTEFFSLTHHVECSVWDSMSFAPPMQGGVKFVNSHTNTDSKLIDYGQIVVFVDQVVATGAIVGDLIIDYEVELIDPQQASFDTQVFKFPTAATTFQNDPSLVVSGVNAVSADFSSSTSATALFYIPEGYFNVLAVATDTGSGTPAWANPTTSGLTGVYNNTSDATVTILNMVVKSIGNGNYVTLTLNTVTVANCEGISFTFTRIPAHVYINSTIGTAF